MKINDVVIEFEQSISNDNKLDAERILSELHNRVFPIHNKESLINCRRYYYYLKQHNKYLFNKLNCRLKQVVEAWLGSHGKST